MLTTILADERTWCVNTIDDTAFWSYALSEDCLSALDEFIQGLRRQPRPITELRIQDLPISGLMGLGCKEICGESLQHAVAALNAGRGFAIIERVPVEQYTIEEAQAIYWVLANSSASPLNRISKGPCCTTYEIPVRM